MRRDFQSYWLRPCRVMRYEDTTGAWRRRRSTTGHQWVRNVWEASRSCLWRAKRLSRSQWRCSAPWKVWRLPQTSLRRQHVIVPNAVATRSHGIVGVHGRERRARVSTRRATWARWHTRRISRVWRWQVGRTRGTSHTVLADAAGRPLRGRWWLAGRSYHCCFVVFHGHGNVSPLVICRKLWRRRSRWPIGRRSVIPSRRQAVVL